MNLEPRTIVIFNHRHMGDALGSMPAILALRKRWPDARLVNVAAPLPLSLFEHVSFADKLIAQPKTWRGTLSALREVRREKPDVAICLSGSLRVSVMARFCGAKVRAGYSPSKYTWPLTLKVPRQGPPSTPLDLSMARALSAPTVAENYIGLLQITDEERATAANWLRAQNVAEAKPLVGINMGASVARRRWSIENFAAVANDLGDEAQIIAFGGPGDLKMIGQLQAQVAEPILVAAGAHSPRETAALMERCATLVTGDTGPMHLAMAVETPVVALFGLVPSSLRVPPNRGHIALEHNAVCQQLPQAKCAFEAHCECLAQITPAEVVAATRAQLAKIAATE